MIPIFPASFSVNSKIGYGDIILELKTGFSELKQTIQSRCKSILPEKLLFAVDVGRENFLLKKDWKHQEKWVYACGIFI